MEVSEARSVWKRSPSSPLLEHRIRWGETALKLLFLSFASISVLTTIGIIGVLIFETVEFFRIVPVWKFLTDTAWTPLFGSQNFGIMVLVSATILTSAIAMALAVPIGLLTAIFLSEYASERWRRILKPMVELLAGVPTVVYGYFALLFVTPLLQVFFPGISGFNALSAGLVMGVMIIPTVASVSEDSLYAVPRSLREGAYALGATKRQVTTRVVVPAALSGVMAACILGISRAVGETMIVTIAAGMNPNLTFDPFVAVQTMTAFIVQVSLGDTPHTSLAYKTIFAVGMTLFLMTLTLNLISHWFVRRYRERY
ncbi:MAG: phosphate ABC transporter permease subunit PstC [Dehalococcoidia bacterium]